MAKTHLARLTEVMTTDAVVLTSLVSQRWVSGFDYTDGYIFITRRRAYLLADFRYIEAAKAAVSAEDFEVIMPEGSMLDCILEIARRDGVYTIAYEDDTLPCAALTRLQKKLAGAEFVPAGNLINALREYKDEDELATIARAQKIADAAFAHIVRTLTPNMTEIEVALELDYFMRKNGADEPGFQTIAVSGSASSRPHGVPRPIKLERGFLTMDFGARVDGYTSDMTRTVVLGRADAEMKALYDTVLRAQLAGLEAAREGANCRAVDSAARDIIYATPAYHGKFGHGLGHGVGMYIHEAPRLSQGAAPDAVLERGHVVTVEPGIYLEGKYGCRIEDMIAIMPDGTMHNFTASPKEMIELF
ncbi:MAG: aminopeptidase P family protein [Clostridia bacterium]|nr:aminopeptidase P family protein [Clostridia bacterium]